MADTAETFDIAVIGAGVMGATTALHLARGGMTCVLVDRRGVCSEASGVNAGTLTMQMTRSALIPYALAGWRMWTSVGEWLGSDPGVVPTDGLSLAFTDDEAALLERRAEARRAYGVRIDMISPARAREIEPGLSGAVKAATHCSIDGYVTANRTGLAYRLALADAGVVFRENTAIRGIGRDEGGFALMTDGVADRARRIVLAGGAWLEEMLGWLGVHIPIQSLNNQLSVTERLRPVMRTVLGIANGLLSLKQFGNGTVVIGGGWQGWGNRETRETRILPENLIGNLRLARHAIPALSDTRIVRAWVGFEAETADAMPIIGEVPGVADAYVIGSVHSGYTSGPYMGKLLAQRILGSEPEMPLFAPSRLLAGA